MLRRGEGDTKNSGSSRTLPSPDARFCDAPASPVGRRRRRSGPTIDSNNGGSMVNSAWMAQPQLRGLLKLISGQIGTTTATMHSNSNNSNNNSNSNSNVDSGSLTAPSGLVSVYRYHGETLRTSQVELQSKPRSRRRRRRRQQEQEIEYKHKQVPSADEECGFAMDTDSASQPFLEHSSTTLPFATVVARKRFAAFFVVQGHEKKSASACATGSHHCYSAHTLALRKRLARDYHDVMGTFVLDLTAPAPGESFGGDDELFEGYDCESNRRRFDSGSADFCRGTGFAVVPTTSRNTSTLLMLLGGIQKVPFVVVVDTVTGRTLPKDAMLAIQTNDPHSVVQRWQHPRRYYCPSGLTPCQTLGKALLCGSEDYSCCVVQ
eukprot:jgi/Psemu1/42227/gm1.42227_g